MQNKSKIKTSEENQNNKNQSDVSQNIVEDLSLISTPPHVAQHKKELPPRRKLSQRKAVVKATESIQKTVNMLYHQNKSKQRIKREKPEIVTFTQEQMLEEAKITEKLNTESLIEQLKLEDDKKKLSIKKKKFDWNLLMKSYNK